MGFFIGVLVKGLDFRGLLQGYPVEPVNPSNYHITILYLGDEAPPRQALDVLAERISCMPCIRLRGRGLTLFPSVIKPKALVIEFEENPVLIQIRNYALALLENAKVRVRDRHLSSFRPHMTIARIKAKIDGFSLLEEIERGELGKAISRLVVTINSISLIRALGEVYYEVYKMPLSCMR